MKSNRESKDAQELEIEEIQRQAQKVQKSKAVITAAVLILMVLCTIVFWDASDRYLIQLEGDRNQGYEWSYTLSGQGNIKEISNFYEEGMFNFEFQGVRAGKVEINFICVRNGDNSNPADKVIYYVRVDKNLNIINKIIKN